MPWSLRQRRTIWPLLAREFGRAFGGSGKAACYAQAGILEDARELASRRAAGQYFLQNGLAQKAARTGSREQAGARKAGPCGCIWPYSRALPGCFCRMAGRAAALTQQSRRLEPPLAAQSPRTAGNDNARGLWTRVSPRGPDPGLPEYRQCVQCRWTGVPYWAGCRLRPVPPA